MKNYFSFSSRGVSLTGNARIDYKIGDEAYSFVPDFTDGTADDGRVKVTCHTADGADGVYSIWLDIENISGGDIYLAQAYPAIIDGAELNIGGTPQKDWVVYSQGRHKNDLPSVCTLGKRDECWHDMLAALTEGGAVIPAEIKDGETTVTGDSLSVIYGGESALTLSYATGKSQMSETALRVRDDGSVVAWELGCVFGCIMPAGKVRHTEVICFDADPDAFAAIDRFADKKAELYGSRALAQKNAGVEKPSLWCSWYYYGGSLTPADITENLGKIKEFGLPFTHFQLDDGWQICYGDWLEGDKYSTVGMKAVADEIRAAGLIPGIWTCPFITHKHSSIVTEHPDWLLKRTNGEYGWFVNKFHVLDVTHPEVLSWLSELYTRVSREWGFGYHKLDFTRAYVQVPDPAPYDPTLTPTEAYTAAVQVIRDAMGEDAYFLMCGGLYDPLIGIVDGQRTGADVTSMWIEDGCNYPTLPYTVKQNALRYYMNKWWNNDPDAMMVRRREEGSFLQVGKLNDEEVKTFTVNQYFGGGLFCTTEKLAEIDADRLDNVTHVMPVVDTEPVPRHLPMCERFQSQVDVKVNAKWGDTWHTVVFVNWDEKPMTLSVTLDKDLCGDFIEAGKKYNISTFYSRELFADKEAGETVVMGEIAPHGSEIVRIGEAGKAQIIFSDMHYSFGGELDEVTEEGDIYGENKFGTREARYSVLMPDGEIKDFVL